MMKRSLGIAALVSIALVGCGDDTDGTTKKDGGADAFTPVDTGTPKPDVGPDANQPDQYVAAPTDATADRQSPGIEAGPEAPRLPDAAPDVPMQPDSGRDAAPDAGPDAARADAAVDSAQVDGGGVDGGGVDGSALISFTEIPYPLSDSDKRAVIASSSVTVKGVPHAIGFNTILRSGQQAGDGIFGQLYKADGTVLTAEDNSPRISDDNDHSTFIDVFGKVFMVSQFESRPGAFYITELSQSSTDGKLTAVKTKPIDFSALGGGWVHCAGSRSPWKTHLGSEEYEPDARLIDPTTGVKYLNKDGTTVDSYYGAMGDYYGGDMTKVKPYRYGFVIEAKITSADMGTGTFASNVTVAKHYSMGRLALELPYVMPDRKTVYMTDDGAMVGLFMYKATTAEDLSAGTLYAAKLTQTSATGGGTFTINWINLGTATDGEIKTFIDMDLKFADLFDAVTPTRAPGVDGGAADGGEAELTPFVCPDGYTPVSHGHEAQAGNTFNECLKLKTSNDKSMSAADIEKAASRLETRRYAALKGATLELNKEEGITFDPDHMKLYVAMSDVTNGMTDNTEGALSTTEAFSGNDIHVAANRCGIVYEMPVNTSYEATSMAPLVAGVKSSYAAGTTYAGNTCDVNGIANPDNITYLPGYNLLIIGEDTGSGHQNDLIWAYDLTSRSLTRILSTPYGSEVTSPFWYSDVNGWGYLVTVVQHPYGESDSDKAEAGAPERHAYTGYIGPFPKLD
jgi:secreted PhoX family phosphatase